MSFEKGYRSFPHIVHDNDMDPIREREDFRSLVAQYKQILETEIAKSAKNVVIAFVPQKRKKRPPSINIRLFLSPFESF